MTLDVSLDWFHSGDLLSLTGPELTTRLRDRGGIYFWTYTNAHSTRVVYIGEAKSFHARFVDHFSNLFAGRYTTVRVPDRSDPFLFYVDRVFRPEFTQMLRDPDVAWPGEEEKAPMDLGRFFGNGRRREIAEHYARHLRFFFADAQSLTDRRSRAEVEAILMKGVLQEYARELWSGDLAPTRSTWGRGNGTPLGSISCYPRPDTEYRITHAGRECGLPGFPPEILAVKGWHKGMPIISGVTAA